MDTLTSEHIVAFHSSALFLFSLLYFFFNINLHCYENVGQERWIPISPPSRIHKSDTRMLHSVLLLWQHSQYLP